MPHSIVSTKECSSSILGKESMPLAYCEPCCKLLSEGIDKFSLFSQIYVYVSKVGKRLGQKKITLFTEAKTEKDCHLDSKE